MNERLEIGTIALVAGPSVSYGCTLKPGDLARITTTDLTDEPYFAVPLTRRGHEGAGWFAADDLKKPVWWNPRGVSEPGEGYRFLTLPEFKTINKQDVQDRVRVPVEYWSPAGRGWAPRTMPRLTLAQSDTYRVPIGWALPAPAPAPAPAHFEVGDIVRVTKPSLTRGEDIKPAPGQLARVNRNDGTAVPYRLAPLEEPDDVGVWFKADAVEAVTWWNPAGTDRPGEGYRFLTVEEHASIRPSDVKEFWHAGLGRWLARVGVNDALTSNDTYRVPIGQNPADPEKTKPAPGHNPERVTCGQLDPFNEGWRLLMPAEIGKRDCTKTDIEAWVPSRKIWCGGYSGACDSITYRTRRPVGFYLTQPAEPEAETPEQPQPRPAGPTTDERVEQVALEMSVAYWRGRLEHIDDPDLVTYAATRDVELWREIARHALS